MDCINILNKILFYLDNELTETDRAKFESHIKECPQCKTLYDNVAATYSLISIENQLAVSPFFYHKLKTKLTRKDDSKIIKIFSTALKPIAVAASIALGIIIGNEELDVLNIPVDDTDVITENFTPVLPADYSVWISLNEDYGNED